ncbi:protein FAM241B-like [Rhopilema esculentum]|uniref:protein FAM241B-like n=1 Tax=Rhopilema esculentum TaxID=499914 RepID=UPI0031D38270|eukprot:gene8662-14678_t
MVKIIDGEIVQDDDPRAIEWERQQRQGQGWNDPRLRNSRNNSKQQSTTQSPAGAFGRMGQGPMAQGQANPQQGASPFQALNEKLSDFGLRPWNVGDHVIEPIFQVALILALVFFGFQGLIVVGVLWYMFGRTPRHA